MKRIVFEEHRQSGGKELFVLIGIFLLAAVYRLFNQYVFVSEAQSVPLVLLAGIILALIAASIYLYKTRMDIRINHKNIRYRFSPWETEEHKIRWKEVDNYKVLESNLITQLCGWSVNFGDEVKRYPLSPRSGLLLNLKNGNEVFIGTRRTSKLKRALKQLAGE